MFLRSVDLEASPINLPDRTCIIEAKTIDEAGNETDIVSVIITLYGEQLAVAQQVV